MQTGDILRERYRVDAPLGGSSGRVTYRGTDLSTGGAVALKTLSLEGLSDWRELESLEREARLLRNLRHPGIPEYVDYFGLEGASGTTFVLVQRLIQGRSLRDMVESGWRGTEAEIRRIGAQMLSIVAFLHDLNPPVIHRDINPKNVLLDERGTVYLVDFGGVQDALGREGAAISSAGVTGYVPPEQEAGAATVRSDLYACAATILFLLTHRSPSELPLREGKVDFRQVISVSGPLAFVLDRLLESDERRRTLGAREAATALTEGTIEHAPQLSEQPPFGSRIRLDRSGGSLVLVVPERGNVAQAGSILLFSGFWLLFVAFWTGMSVAMGAPILFPLFSIPFWVVGIGLARKGLAGFFGQSRIELSPDTGLRYARRLFLPPRVRTVPIAQVGQAAVGPKTGGFTRQGNVPAVCHITAGATSFCFGEFLSEVEKQWLCDTINQELRALRR